MSALIGLVGLSGSGKSEVSKVLQADGFAEVGFADALKDAFIALDPIINGATGVRLSELIAWRDWETPRQTLEHAKAHLPEVRRILQRLGTEVGRDLLGEDTWVNAWRRTIGAMDSDTSVVVPDVRFINEQRGLSGFQFDRTEVWLVVRPGQGEPMDHPSEALAARATTEWRDDGKPWWVDRVIINDSDLTDLALRVKYQYGLAQDLTTQA